MHALLSFAVTAALALASVGTPVKMLAVEKFAGQVKPNSFIVTLKPGVAKSAHLEKNRVISGALTHTDWDSEVLHGFAGTFNTTQLEALRASDDVPRFISRHTMAVTTQ